VLLLTNLMSIANFLNPIEEEDTDRFFMDKELIIISQQNPDEDEEQEEAEEAAVVSITKGFSKMEQIKL
jgi:hypothetical protein